MSLQPAGQTLQASALVREVYLRLGASEKPSWDHRGHFFAAAIEAMRHILVDNARRKQRAKHGGDPQRVDGEAIEIAAAGVDGQAETWKLGVIILEALPELVFGEVHNNCHG